MSRDLKNNNEELIIYQYDNSKSISKEKKNEIYNKILKIQNRNAKIFSIGIFLITFAITYLFVTLDYFEQKELEGMWLLSSLFIGMIGIILITFCNVTSPKEGKIKYKYKNNKYFFISLLISGIGITTALAGLDNIVIISIGLVLIDISLALDAYHDKTKGNKKISLFKEIIIAFFVCVLCTLLGLLINYKINPEDDFINTYSKSALVIYDEIDRPSLISKSNNSWYILTNEYNTNHYELSVSKKPENLNIVYQIDDVKIQNLKANDDYATWNEITEDKILYAYYDKEENQPYELTTLSYNKEEYQNMNIGLYKDKIYYEEIDYENNKVNVIQFDITNNETSILYTIENALKQDLIYNTINIENNNLLLTTCANGKLAIIHFDLDKCSNNNYYPKIIVTDQYNANAFAASYDNGKYALYYYVNGKEKIGIFNKTGKLERIINTFNSNNYAYLDKVKLKDKKVYWINYIKEDEKVVPDNFKLMIYDLKEKDTQEVNKIFDFYIDNKEIYGLGYYGKDTKNVRLYEIYN